MDTCRLRCCYFYHGYVTFAHVNQIRIKLLHVISRSWLLFIPIAIVANVLGIKVSTRYRLSPNSKRSRISPTFTSIFEDDMRLPLLLAIT
jgi:hypothetical protein